MDFTIRDLPDDCLCWGETDEGARTSTFRTHPRCPVHVGRPETMRVILTRSAEASPAAAPEPPLELVVDSTPVTRGDVRVRAAHIHEQRGHSWPLEMCTSCQDRAGRV